MLDQLLSAAEARSVQFTPILTDVAGINCTADEAVPLPTEFTALILT